MNIDDVKCGLCGSEIQKFKIKSSEGIHKSCICIITDGIDGFSGFLECLCNECLKKIKNGEILKIPSIDEVLPNDNTDSKRS